MSIPSVLAVDCGAGHVACGQLNTDKSGRLSLVNFTLDTLNPDPGLEVQWHELLGESIENATKRFKSSNPGVLGLPGHLTLSKFIKTPAVEKAKRAKILQFEAQQNIPYPLNEVVWDYLAVSDGGLDLEVMLAAAKSDIVEQLCALAESAGLPIVDASPSSVATLRCFRYNYPEVAEHILILDIGARSTDLIFVNGEHFFVRTIPLAGNSVTQAIAEEIGQDFSHSEVLKLQVLSGTSDLPQSSPARAAVGKAVQSFLSRLQLEITRSTVNYRRQSGAEQPICIFLTGAGSLVSGLEEFLGDKLKIQVERMDPLRNVEVGSNAVNAVEYGALLSGLIGLAVPGDAESKITLLPQSLASKLAFKKRQPMLIGAMALVALALLPPLVQSQRLLSATNAQANQYETALLPLRTINNRNKENLAKIDEATQEIEAIRSLVESKSNWINFLTDLQERLNAVGDVWLDDLEVLRDNQSGDGGGFGGGFGGGMDNAPPVNEDGSPVSPTVKLQLSGRLVDINNPLSKVSPDSLVRVKTLLESFTQSQFISSIEKERFDTDQPGILRFDFTLVVDPKRPL